MLKSVCSLLGGVVAGKLPLSRHCFSHSLALARVNLEILRFFLLMVIQELFWFTLSVKVCFDIDARSVVPAPPAVVEQTIAGLPCDLIFPTPLSPIAFLHWLSKPLLFIWRSDFLIDHCDCWITGIVRLTGSVHHIGGTGTLCL